MPSYFLDTSALSKRYHQELGTQHVDDLMAKPQSEFFISRLAVVELHSVFARHLRAGHISLKEFRILRGKFLADIAEFPGLLK